MDRKHFFLPVNTGYVEGKLPNNQCLEFYESRSGHGLYCTIVGNVVIPNGFGTNNVCAEISSSEVWSRLAKRIGDRGARAGIQLSSTWHKYAGIKRFVARPNDNPILAYKSAVASMSSEDIEIILKNLRFGTDLAIRAGFRHVQLHAAHGYLFSLLIDKTFFHHNNMVLDALNLWAEHLNTEGIESSLRFSLLTGDIKSDLDGRDKTIDMIFKLPLSFFDVSNGFYNINKKLIYPSTDDLLASRREATLELARRFPNKEIIASGRLNSAWEDSLPTNVHIGICRDLIANPDFLRDRSMGCTNCMKCHYYSRGESKLVCGRWNYTVPDMIPD